MFVLCNSVATQAHIVARGSVVKPGDKVYHLCDVMFGDREYFQKIFKDYIPKIYPELKGNIDHQDNLTLYENGDHITPHNDGENSARYCVIIIYLSDKNDYNNGGGELEISEYGTTLKLFAEAVDEKIKQLNVLDFSLPFLRISFVVNTMKQFAEAVDTKLSTLSADITSIGTLVNTQLTTIDSTTIDFTTSGTLNHTLTAGVKISASVNNLLTANLDGLYAAPQTLTLNSVNKTIAISNGNTIDLSSIICTPSGFLGSVSSDPTNSINGNYWWNTTSSTLKIKVNNTIRTITTT
jgi:hypothetical protein